MYEHHGMLCRAISYVWGFRVAKSHESFRMNESTNESTNQARQSPQNSTNGGRRVAVIVLLFTR